MAKNFGARPQSGGFKGQLRKRQSRDTSSLLPKFEKRIGKNFLIFVNDRSWEFVCGDKTNNLKLKEHDGGEWLPVIGESPIDPGCNGVDDAGNTTLMEQNLRMQGNVIIHAGDPILRDVLPEGEYVAIWESTAGKVYKPVWMRPVPGPRSNRVIWEVDLELKKRVQRKLLDAAGEVPNPYLVREQIRVLQSRIEELQKKDIKALSTRLRLLEKKLAAMESTLPEIEAKFEKIYGTSNNFLSGILSDNEDNDVNLYE